MTDRPGGAIAGLACAASQVWNGEAELPRTVRGAGGSAGEGHEADSECLRSWALACIALAGTDAIAD